MGDNMRLRRKVRSLTEDIMGEVDHGECFYEKDMLDGFIGKLDELKVTAQKYFESNQEEMEDDEG